MMRNGAITPTQAQDRLRGPRFDHIERMRLVAEPASTPLAHGVPASKGIAAESVVFDARRAAELAAQGWHVILARPDLRAGDIAGIAAADGVLTAVGGRTSHAAIVARQLGKVCLVGCGALKLEADERHGVIGETRLAQGDGLTLDGGTRDVYAGCLVVAHERPERNLAEWQRLVGLTG